MRIFAQKTIDDLLKNEYTALECSLRLMCRGLKAFSQFIDILIKTKQNYITNVFEDYPEFQLLLSFHEILVEF